ncbi:MAG TPA: response regulator [Rhizomicrobium sp.]|nr:response regulator [Rhizomicrobium sp.]
MAADAFHEPWVFVVDDDWRFRGALEGILSHKGYKVAAFASPVEFLDRHDPKLHGCLLLDFQMPELNGLDVQSTLAALGETRPVVFLTGTDSVDVAVSAMKGGAQNYLVKPVGVEAVLDSVKRAIEKDKTCLKNRIERTELLRRWRSLSYRQQEAFWHVVSGRLNKQIAHDMGITEKTVKVHRAQMMEKLKAHSTAALAQFAGRILPLCH